MLSFLCNYRVEAGRDVQRVKFLAMILRLVCAAGTLGGKLTCTLTNSFEW